INDYFIDLVKGVLKENSYDVKILSPEKAEERSSHVAIQHENADAISSLLREKGFITDFRPPNVIRLAFSPLYNTYHEAWLTVMAIKEIIDNEEHQSYKKRDEKLVT
ncbi:MAG: kynureninase, partial [Candidatus Thermoplasmatota archaeon]